MKRTPCNTASSPRFGSTAPATTRGSNYHPDLFAEFPNIQFFDYTKLYRRVFDFLECTFPANYHLRYSVNARTVGQSQDILRRGGTVAAFFWPDLPTT